MSQVANEQEVKGQIKLRFHTSTAQPVVVQRSFQVGCKLLSGKIHRINQVLGKDTYS